MFLYLPDLPCLPYQANKATKNSFLTAHQVNLILCAQTFKSVSMNKTTQELAHK